MKEALAFLFQREGGEIDKEDFVYVQSVDLDWFNSDKARKLLEKAVEKRLVKTSEDTVKANFDYESVDIEMGFEPDEDILESGKQEFFSELLGKLVDRSEMSKQEVMSKTNKKQDDMNITTTVALILVAYEQDVLDAEEQYEHISFLEEKITDKE